MAEQNPEGTNPSHSENRISKEVTSLINSYKSLPKDLTKVSKAIDLHSELINEVSKEIESLKAIPRNEMDNSGLPAKKITRNKKIGHKLLVGSLNVDLRSLRNSQRRLEKHYESIAAKKARELTLQKITGMVVMPDYYKKYGHHIPKSLANIFTKPMHEKAHEKLKVLQAKVGNAQGDIVANRKLDQELNKFLSKYYLHLYAKCMGCREHKAEYFKSFKEDLLKWDPESAQIKKIKRLF